MSKIVVRKSPLSWWVAGLLLGLIQVAAIGLYKPLGVSTQFVVADAKVINRISPDYAQSHPLISSDKYQKIGYGWWLDIGLIIGAFAAALATRRWKYSTAPVWWHVNRTHSIMGRFVTCFIGGFLILLGARFARGCTSGQFASGWAQLSLSVIPFTITLFGFGMLIAYIVYPRKPEIEE